MGVKSQIQWWALYNKLYMQIDASQLFIKHIRFKKMQKHVQSYKSYIQVFRVWINFWSTYDGIFSHETKSLGKLKIKQITSHYY